jgi:hypothetical protein
MEASTQISKENLGDQAPCDRIGVPTGSSWEAVRVKPKLQWRPQDAAVARNVDHLLRKATGNRAAIPKRGLVACSWQGHRERAPQVHWSSHHNRTCPVLIDMELQDLIFFLLVLSLALVPSLLSMPLCITFAMGIFTVCYYVLEMYNFILVL